MSVMPTEVKQRITLYIDEALEKSVVAEAQRLGADAYICSYCSGKPLHLAFEGVAPVRLLVRVELLADAATGEAIMAYVQQLQDRRYPVTAVVDAVITSP